jgi:hypothetical protein
LSQIFENMGEKKDQAEATLQAFGRQVGRQVSRQHNERFRKQTNRQE